MKGGLKMYRAKSDVIYLGGGGLFVQKIQVAQNSLKHISVFGIFKI